MNNEFAVYYIYFMFDEYITSVTITTNLIVTSIDFKHIISVYQSLY